MVIGPYRSLKDAKASVMIEVFALVRNWRAGDMTPPRSYVRFGLAR